MAERHIVVDHSRKAWLGVKSVLSDILLNIRNTASSGNGGSRTKDEQASSEHEDLPQKQSVIENARSVRSELKRMTRKAHRSVRSSVFAENGTNGHTKTAGPTIPEDKKQDIIARGQKVYLEPKSIIAEAYRTVRTAVFFGVPKGQAKTILVTSPAPGDGKSTLVSNLALTMAQAGQKTLVLDADFRKPMQHNIFGIDNCRGLAHILSGDSTIDEAVYAGPINGLDILPCGAEVPNPSEILNSKPFAELLNKLAQRYDRVIVDSPPVTPVADSQILAAICEVTLLVLRAEKSTRRHSQQARDALLSVGGHLLGAIVNDVPKRQGHYGYYSGYGQYGGYGHYGYSNDK